MTANDFLVILANAMQEVLELGPEHALRMTEEGVHQSLEYASAVKFHSMLNKLTADDAIALQSLMELYANLKVLDHSVPLFSKS